MCVKLKILNLLINKNKVVQKQQGKNDKKYYCN